MTDTLKPNTPPAATTVRLGSTQTQALERICKVCNITRNALINLAVDAFADHVERTGKLPIPKLRKGGRGGKNE